MTSIPGGYVTRHHQVAPAKVPCTCGAKDAGAALTDDRNRRQTKIQPVSKAHASPTSSDATMTTTLAAPAPLKRSLWRKMLGKGPKCVCRKRALSLPSSEPEPELLKIPSEYVGCKHVLVAGKRVAFTREMQQKLRKSWDPLEAIDED